MSQNKPYTSLDIANCGFIDPQVQLSSALANGNIREFRNALDMGAEPTRQDDKHVSVFEKALKTNGCAEFVEECLQRGCNVNYLNNHLKKAAINYAADSKDPRILAALLRHNGVDVNRKCNNLTALNSLAKNLTADNLSDVTACISLLLNYGASPNIPDQREMTPLHYILKNKKIDEHKKRELLQLFLSHADLDIDSYRDGEVRQLLSQQYADLQLPAVKAEHSQNVSFDSLLTYIRSADEDKFLQQFEAYQLNVSNKDNLLNSMQQQYLPLLVEATKRGMPRAIEQLLASGININQTHNGNTPIEIASIWGNWAALQKFLDHEHLKLRKSDQLLINVIKKLDEEPLHDYCNYQKCFYTLLNSERVDVNEPDQSGSTPLHYAVKYRNRQAVQELLKHGAYIGTRSAFNDLPIDGMHPDLLEEHFDACISTNGQKPGDESFEILMNFSNLIPFDFNAHPEKPISQHKLREEMTPIAYIAESKEHRHLLQHPLITSFLFLKWHRLSVIFYINFLFYSLFATAIIVHTILKFQESEHQSLTTLFGLFSWIGIIYLLLREGIQFVMSPTTYFRSPINWLEIALIVLAIITCSEPNYDRETQRIIAVFTILLVAIELCLLVGSLPVLSISTHMLMLRAVCKTFLKCFTLYSIFVLTFTLCFYILFGKPDTQQAAAVQQPSATNQTETAVDDAGDFNKFTNPFLALIKTIVMMTGEFDAGDIDFESSSYVRYLIFLLFVFFMSIVLFNLLNGLAVSDTQIIKAQAELNGSICRTQLLSQYETVLTGRAGRTSFIVTHEPFRSICRRLMNIYPNYLAARQIAILPNENNKVMLPIPNNLQKQRQLPLTNNDARQTKATFLSLSSTESEQPKKPLDPPVQLLPCCCSCISERCSEMDSRTVKLAMAVIERKNIAQAEKQRKQSTEKRLENIEAKLAKMFELLQDLQNK